MYKFKRAKHARTMGYYPYYPPIESSDVTEITMQGEKKIMLGSNNYLGLTNHPKVIEAGVIALKKYGSGLTGSRLLNGNLILHEELETKIASFVKKESALVFSTGYGANLGVIGAIASIGTNSVVYSDDYNHASIIDGCTFSRAEIVRFRHNDMVHLEQLLSEKGMEDKAKFIVTDAVFSMHGDTINLPELIKLSQSYGARTMIDEAHSIGLYGPHGEGVAAYYDLSNAVDIIMGTFSKSLGSIGGFIAGEGPIIDYLKHHARTMIFTAALPAVNVATALKSLEIIANEPEHKERLWENVAFMRHNLKSMGYETGDGHSAIIPLIVGRDYRTFLFWKALLKAGIYTNPIIPPAVPKGSSLIRTSYIATHTRQQLEYCLDKFESIGKKQNLI
ncbi:MAG: aminotransferase class I/II-fold pyridoxal phosphate-dependent enzyme [Candidatus Marinimicrobia bacterium]|nr:aminotransferase class I/II-fold pyridoxal phosphate-dependent enzyme [Candidatus Neomarinimicrobiota bacterium]